MDQEAELAKFKLILFALVVFLVSGFFAYGELKFSLWGKTAQANISRTFETEEPGRRGRSRPLLAVEYSFTEADGTPRNERDDVPRGSQIPSSGPITVEYLPGVADSSRILGHSSKMAVYVFLGCLAILAFAGFQLWRMASDAVNDKPRRVGRR